MLKDSKAFSGIAVADIDAAKAFYGETLGLDFDVDDDMGGMITLYFAGERPTLIYPSPTATPASFTILNFPVDDVAGTVKALEARGVTFERYEGTPGATDDDGVFRKGGPEIAWFKDPAGNVLSIIEA